VSGKSAKISTLLEELISHDPKSATVFDPHYRGFFECFNRQMYYEAHDVLEELWLKTKGNLHFFYKGLIQLAGAFVHLKKGKLNPAARLFRLALKNLTPFGNNAEGLDLGKVVASIKGWLKILEESDYQINPYQPSKAPILKLQIDSANPET
jgi:hypothetical protein